MPLLLTFLNIFTLEADCWVCTSLKFVAIKFYMSTAGGENEEN